MSPLDPTFPNLSWLGCILVLILGIEGIGYIPLPCYVGFTILAFHRLLRTGLGPWVCEGVRIIIAHFVVVGFCLRRILVRTVGAGFLMLMTC